MEKSPLSRLSGELRNMIYKYVLYEPKGIPVFVGPQQVKYTPYGKRELASSKLEFGVRKPAFLGLSWTCRALRKETRGIYRSVNDTIEFYRAVDDTIGYHSGRTGFQLAPARPMGRLADIFGVKSAWEIRRLRLHIAQIDLEIKSAVGFLNVLDIVRFLRCFKANFHPEASMSLVLDTAFYSGRPGGNRRKISIEVDLRNLEEARTEVRKLGHQVYRGHFRLFPEHCIEDRAWGLDCGCIDRAYDELNRFLTRLEGYMPGL
ncbi:hypothetical protein CLAFUW4_03401 [Fulvia fulva]|uniref:Uncharacterized protein n=1 Tax=Passalora fulva TaxID=5499 RepID=A0A9Q8LAU8_PASFU|nr:uncharacterized protein CLAFUR5_03382 [Fulvia fulva]KAK4631588.1 hypothetical protein CLAFUR4_03390 [Fulvia fulva]KAK4633429.1 hypothetical protein CLAFUR0_03395 [Fulvia fulva]UJO13975.1 hypothetical protein CLAFUR5_03382 [Fulvia fulva]WPV11333.1 hypothetical protein CLAFUW4_03401 [Fulvia fulva]WPV25571.1 hypothetical protein CLAFUW7_03393 [Fulvia fulva]